MDSAHCISFFISSTITPSLIQRVQTESSKSVKHRKADILLSGILRKNAKSPPILLRFDLSGLDPALCPVGCDTPSY